MTRLLRSLPQCPLFLDPRCHGNVGGYIPWCVWLPRPYLKWIADIEEAVATQCPFVFGTPWEGIYLRAVATLGPGATCVLFGAQTAVGSEAAAAEALRQLLAMPAEQRQLQRQRSAWPDEMPVGQNQWDPIR